MVTRASRDRLAALFPDIPAADAFDILLRSFERKRANRAQPAAVPVLGTTESDGVERLNAGRASATGSAVRS